MIRTRCLTLPVLILLGSAQPAARAAETPFCELYAVGHFGNWYEVAGVNLTAISSAPYDYGGCACDQCKPWIITFAQLTNLWIRPGQLNHP